MRLTAAQTVLCFACKQTGKIQPKSLNTVEGDLEILNRIGVSAIGYNCMRLPGSKLGTMKTLIAS